jgi:hypothetical protein
MDHDRMVELAHRNLLGVFAERDPQARADAIKEIYAEHVTFSDPDEVLVGHEALDRKAQQLLDNAPDFVFRPAGPVRVAQNHAHLPWHFGPDGQPPVVSGVDVSIVADGRITQLYTLLDPAEPPA